MGEIKYKFSKDNQRRYNNSGKIRQENIPVRKDGRAQFNVTIDLTMKYLKNYSPPDGIDFVRYAVKDPITKQIIPPFTREYDNFHPVNCTFIASEVHPFPLERFTEMDLYTWLNETFGKYITNWNLTKEEEPGLESFAFGDTMLFKHEGMMETNEATDQKQINNKMFNVREKPIYDHELDWLNERLEIMGYKTKPKKSDALMVSEKTINSPRKYYFEYGDF